MSLANRAAEYMLSDALLPDNPEKSRGLRLELPLDRIITLVSVGLPLLLISLAFAREISTGPQVVCFPPSNYTEKQIEYVNKHCWHSLTHHDFNFDGSVSVHSLWIHKVFPYTLMIVAVAMYIPVVLWKYTSKSLLNTDLLFIVDELDKSYNRSIKLVQHLLKAHRTCSDPNLFWEELKSARHVRYFEFPLLERYLTCKQHSHCLVLTYLLRNVLLLLFIALTCIYLGVFHLTVFYQEEFTCLVKTRFLRTDIPKPEFVNCKFVSLTIFQIVSVVIAVIYILLVPMLIYNVSKLCYWDKQFLNIYEMLPAFDLLSKKMLGCPINDLNVIILFLRANISELKSYSRLSVLYKLKDTTDKKQNIDTVVDFMTLLVGMDMENGGQNSPESEDEEQPPSGKECYELGKDEEKS
ncbi:pannexin-3 [Xenopus laevis]|uniref:Pannexin n=2 Tax=Xenopus laevis TaxID=8355 RepID=A0A974HAK0_XENLA|nr:pannexin-3 [Xenopus laevis]OCT70426.1 hypothetical protein XELAEV_18037345mg [Xenopus laevis]